MKRFLNCPEQNYINFLGLVENTFLCKIYFPLNNSLLHENKRMFSKHEKQFGAENMTMKSYQRPVKRTLETKAKDNTIRIIFDRTLMRTENCTSKK